MPPDQKFNTGEKHCGIDVAMEQVEHAEKPLGL